MSHRAPRQNPPLQTPRQGLASRSPGVPGVLHLDHQKPPGEMFSLTGTLFALGVRELGDVGPVCASGRHLENALIATRHNVLPANTAQILVLGERPHPTSSLGRRGSHQLHLERAWHYLRQQALCTPGLLAVPRLWEIQPEWGLQCCKSPTNSVLPGGQELTGSTQNGCDSSLTQPASSGVPEET